MENKDKDIFFQMLQAFKIIKNTLDTCLKKYGLNLLQLGIIALASEKDMTVSKLAETLDVSKSAISQSLLKLYMRRYVTKKMMEGNKKVFYIVNLSKGNKMKNEVFAKLSEIDAEIKAIMPMEEILNLNNLITKYVQILQEINKNERG